MAEANCISFRCPDGQPDVDSDFLKKLATTAKKTPTGAVLRWAALINNTGGIEIALQALPALLTTIRLKPLLAEDTIPVVELASYEVHYKSFNGSLAAGIIPTLSSLDPEESLVRIEDDQARFHKELQKFSGRFVRHELLSLKEAQIIVKKPRTGMGVPLFLRTLPPEAVSQPAPKKARISANSGSPPHFFNPGIFHTRPDPLPPQPRGMRGPIPSGCNRNGVGLADPPPPPDLHLSGPTPQSILTTYQRSVNIYTKNRPEPPLRAGCNRYGKGSVSGSPPPQHN